MLGGCDDKIDPSKEQIAEARRALIRHLEPLEDCHTFVTCVADSSNGSDGWVVPMCVIQDDENEQEDNVEGDTDGQPVTPRGTGGTGGDLLAVPGKAKRTPTMRDYYATRSAFGALLVRMQYDPTLPFEHNITRRAMALASSGRICACIIGLRSRDAMSSVGLPHPYQANQTPSLTEEITAVAGARNIRLGENEDRVPKKAGKRRSSLASQSVGALRPFAYSITDIADVEQQFSRLP